MFEDLTSQDIACILFGAFSMIPVLVGLYYMNEPMSRSQRDDLDKILNSSSNFTPYNNGLHDKAMQQFNEDTNRRNLETIARNSKK